MIHKMPSKWRFDALVGRLFGYIGTEKDIVIPSKINGVAVRTISCNTFYNRQLKSVVIPDSVVVIDVGAFRTNCLTSVKIPDSVKVVDKSAFYDNSLTSVTLSNSLIMIGNYAFCKNKLTSITMPSSMISIGINSLQCNQLTSVVMPNKFYSYVHRICGFGQSHFHSLNRIQLRKYYIENHVLPDKVPKMIAKMHLVKVGSMLVSDDYKPSHEEMIRAINEMA